jgi:hypothetical protein
MDGLEALSSLYLGLLGKKWTFGGQTLREGYAHRRSA